MFRAIKRFKKMEALYKRKGERGFTDREKRKELYKITSKAKRDDLVASRRKMPLGEINTPPTDSSTTKVSPFKTKPDVKSGRKQNDRLQRLREWQQARDEAKAKAKVKNQKPIFVLGGKSDKSQAMESYLAKLTNKSTSSKPFNFTFSAKKHVLNMSPKPGSIPGSHVATSNGSNESKEKNVVLTMKPYNERVVPPSKPVPPSGKRITKNVCKSAPKVQPTRHSARLAVKQTVATATKRVPPKGTLTATRSSKPTGSRKKFVANRAQKNAKTNKNISGKNNTTFQPASGMEPIPEMIPSEEVKLQAPPTPETAPSEKVTLQAPLPPLTDHMAKKMPLVLPVKDVPAIEVISQPSTPVKSYKPILPSPLLCSHSIDTNRRETLYSAARPLFVNDPVWIGGASAPMPDTNVHFDDFGKFSPFRFKGAMSTESEVPFQFTFHMDIKVSEQMEQDSQLLTDSQSTCKDTKNTRSSARRRKSYTMDKEMVEDVVLNLESELDKVKETGELDIKYFRKLHSDACKELVQLCEVWERKTADIKQMDDNDFSMEEVLGQIRVITGKAQLLMRQKLKQYIGLVDTAENQSGERKTSAEDLQGFWDMVYCQVDGLYKAFEELKEMESNGWKLSLLSPKKTKLQKKKMKRGQKAAKEESSERLKAAREKREAERSRLREMKLKARQAQREEEKENQQSEEFKDPLSTAKEIKSPIKKAFTLVLDSPMMCTRSRSKRLRDRSVFSPAVNRALSPSGAKPSPLSEVPTGVLVML